MLVGILGGVGPAAGVLLHQTLLQHTASGGVDQGHLSVCHLSCSADIANRIVFLQAVETEEQEQRQRNGQLLPLQSSGSGSEADRSVVRGVENPAVGMARTFELLRALRTPVVVGVPCVTFHAAPIWREFRRRIETQQPDEEASSSSSKSSVRCINMLDETARLLAQVAPRCCKVGVMATTGTRHTRVFHDLLEPLGYEVLEVSAQTQAELQDTIENPQWGIKSTAPATSPRCVANFKGYARQLVARGAVVLVLGCTEIPFAFGGATTFDGVPLLDPLVALARALIREANPLRLKPLETPPL
ncbi:hypothetical protein PybrP1_008595 [[Pythium] brassicae (nom. inval.)]|nr:hypothetical protein PybrP1_008595 [[Pythium] brassicae (nom. inval.)]